MVKAIRRELTVQRDHMIQIRLPELKQGTHVEMILLIEELPAQQRSLCAIIGTGKGSFKTPEEVDAFLHRERAQWD